MIKRSIGEDLPVACKPQTFSDDLVKRPFSIDKRVSAARKIVAQFGFDAVRGSPRMVVGIVPFSNAICKRRILGHQEQQPHGRRPGCFSEKVQDANVADAVDDEVIACLKAASSQHVSAEGEGIIIHALLAEILKSLAVVWVALKSSDLKAQIIAEAGPTPSECFCDGEADRRLATADLARKTEKDAHAKSKVNWRDRSATQPRLSRLSQLTGAMGKAASSSINVA